MALLLVGCSQKVIHVPNGFSVNMTGIENLSEAKAAATYNGNGIAAKSSGTEGGSLCLIYDNNEIHLPKIGFEIDAEDISEEDKAELMKCVVPYASDPYLFDFGNYVMIGVGGLGYDWVGPPTSTPISYCTRSYEIFIRKSDGLVIDSREVVDALWTALLRDSRFICASGESLYVLTYRDPIGVIKVIFGEEGCFTEFYSFESLGIFGNPGIAADQRGNVYVTCPMDTGTTLLTISSDGKSTIKDLGGCASGCVEYEGDVFLYGDFGIYNISDEFKLLSTSPDLFGNDVVLLSYKDGALAFRNSNNLVKFDIRNATFTRERLTDELRGYLNRDKRIISRKYKGDMYFLDDYSDYVEVKKVNFVDESVELFRRIDVPTGKTLSGYRFNNFGTPILTLNFEDVTMSIRLDSASSEDDLVIESGDIVEVVMLK